MAFKKICQVGLLIASFCFMLPASALAENPFGQTFQINTRLNSFYGKPTWVLIIRDEDTGQILPYEFDFLAEENFWVGFTFSHSYRITSSRLQFGPPNCKIDNFCHLEDGIIKGESFIITLTGDLTPNRFTNSCHVLRYKNFPFPIADISPDEPPPSAAPSSSEAPLSALNNTVPASANTVINTITNAVAPMISKVVG